MKRRKVKSEWAPSDSVVARIRRETEVHRFAFEKHEGQTDDSGSGYFAAHIMQVVNLVKKVTDDEAIITAAYLHDTIEDTNTTYEELVQKFGKEVADLVNEVTNEKIKGAKDYFPRLKSKKAIVLKFADRLSNLSRMDCWDENRQQRYLDRSKFWKGEEIQ